MTLEEYADYAITFLYLRGGPMPQVMNPWKIKDNPAWWGVKHTRKGWDTPQWDNACWKSRSRREAALRYCWAHGLIKRHNKRFALARVTDLRDPDTPM